MALEWLHHAWVYGEGGHWYIRGSGYTMDGYMVKEGIGVVTPCMGIW